MRRCIEQMWAGKNQLYLLLMPFSLLYGAISFVRLKCYQFGLFSSWKAPLPVVVVGNLSAGGNGKTPFVIWLVQQLMKNGFKVGVVSRGYGGKALHYPLIIDETTSTDEAGDEPVLIYTRTRAAVAVSPNRREAIEALLAKQPLDIIVTDDGLQHYALARDIEIVIVDGERRFGNGWWIPAGPLRERVSRLKRVDAVVVNGGQLVSENEIAMVLQARQAINVMTGEQVPANSLVSVVAMAGIGYPPRFFKTLHQLGITPINYHSFADHQRYQQKTVMALASKEQSLLMTEKDAVKCKAFAQANWWYLPVDAVIEETKVQPLLNKIIQSMTTKIRNKG